MGPPLLTSPRLAANENGALELPKVGGRPKATALHNRWRTAFGKSGQSLPLASTGNAVVYRVG